MNIQKLPLEKLNPAPYNPRIITDEEFQGLVESLRTFGQKENLVVNKDGTIISGHQRYRAMHKLGWQEAICDVVDLDKKTEKKLNLTLNNPRIQGKFQDLSLEEILQELKLEDDYESLRLDKLEPLDLSETRKIEPEQEFTTEVLEENNYIVFVFDNKIDWQMIEDHFGIKSVHALQSKEGFEKKGIGRVIDGSKLIEAIDKL